MAVASKVKQLAGGVIAGAVIIAVMRLTGITGGEKQAPIAPVVNAKPATQPVAMEVVGPSVQVTLAFDNPAVPIIDATMANEASKISNSGALAGKENLWFFVRRADGALYLKARYSAAKIGSMDWPKLFPGNGPFLDSADEWQIRADGQKLLDRYCSGSTKLDIPRLCAKAGY